MGTVCHHSKVPLIPISFPQEKESIPNIITTTQVTQSHFSQNLDDFSATLRSNPFRISILKEDIKLVYKFKKNIGYGTFGKVYLARKIGEDDQHKPYAIKVMRDVHKNERIFKIAFREISIMRILDHPNIVKLHEIYEDERHLSLVLEYCSGGELLDYLFDRHHLGEAETAHFMQEIFSAIEYLHNHHICHRDLKLQNFMFDRKGPNSVIKLIDFGLSAQCSTEENLLKTIVGSPLYIAPEIINKKPYDLSCDLWSLGVILYLLLAGEPPFKGSNNREIFENISAGVFDIETGIWENISLEAKNLIQSLLKVDPKERISIQKAIEHSWFDKLLKNEKIECPLRNQERNHSLMAYKAMSEINIFKAFDKDSASHSFSLENNSENIENKEKVGLKKKMSMFRKKKSDEEEGYEDLEVFDENMGMNLKHILV